MTVEDGLLLMAVVMLVMAAGCIGYLLGQQDAHAPAPRPDPMHWWHWETREAPEEPEPEEPEEPQP